MLLSLAALCAVAQAAPEMRLMRFPTVHKETVVFTYAGDLWTTSLSGGLARRLTTHGGLEQFPRFSPDGKWIAFTANYDGNADVYVIPSEGGDPKRLTFDAAGEQVRGWTRDGKVMFVTPEGSPGAFTPVLKMVGPDGGLPTTTKVMEFFDGDVNAAGQVVFNRNNSHSFNWRRYRGGTQGRIGFTDLNGSFYKEIPSGRENRWQPMWVGNQVYYIGDKEFGTRNLYRFDTATNRETRVTNFRDADIKWPSTDGNRIVWERDGYLEVFDIAKGDVSRLSCKPAGDLNNGRPRMFEYGQWLTGFSLSPSGNRVAVAARGEIFSVPARTGETRHIGGDSSSKESTPNWSPDGKHIAFMSDKTGEARIYTMPQLGGDWTELAIPKDHRITNFSWSPDSKMISYQTVDLGLYIYEMESKKATRVLQGVFDAGASYDWSPDSAWIAYVSADAGLSQATYLYNVKDGKTTKITEGYFADDAVAFDRNGRYLYLISKRVFNPTPSDFEFEIYMTNSQRVYAIPLQNEQTNPLNRPGDEEPSEPPAGRPAAGGPPPAGGPAPMKIDLDGLGARAIALPWGPSNYGGLVGLNNGVLVFNQGTWRMFDFNSRTSQDIVSGTNSLDINPSRTKIAYAMAGSINIADLRPGLDANTGRVNLGNCEAVLNPRAEWRQMFWEAWRWQRDRFYDKNMLGLDWMAIGRQYEAYLPYVAHRTDLNYVLGLMIGELGTGHAYVQGGDMNMNVTPIPIGSLGADYEVAGNRIRFKTIYRGLNFEELRRGPLGEPGLNVKEGDYLLAIDGQEIGTRAPGEFMQGKVGRSVKITVNSRPSMEGARTITVRPIANESELRYIEWVEANRRRVSEMSGGKIGYLHVPDTSFDGMIEFAKGFYSQQGKQAVIIDERFNGGGFIPTFFIEKLQRQVKTAFVQRNGGGVGFPPNNLDMPQAMLINEYAGSGGDLFPWLFREAKLGPLIGTRTWGGLVGITGNSPLADGGGVTAPEFGLYDVAKGEWIAENKGVDPDIQVDRNPADVAAGRDPQLDRAVAHLLDQLKKNPRKPYKVPAFPRVKGAGGQ